MYDRKEITRMYVVIGHSKTNLTQAPIVSTNPKGKSLCANFKEARRLRQEMARLTVTYNFTMFRLVYCDQNKEE